MTSSVELGFLEKRTPWKLRSKFFPSKVGGCPAWLRLNNLPCSSDLLCKFCKKPLTFLLQVYAPLPAQEGAFHRTLYLFMCRNEKCNQMLNNESFVVLRSQLPRINEFYSSEPPSYYEKTSLQPSAEQYQPLCPICSRVGVIKCEKCSQVDYCCEDHRDSDWEWNHVHTCSAESEDDKKKKQRKPINNFNLPEFDLVTYREELPLEVPEKSEEEKVIEYLQYLKSSSIPQEFQEMPSGDLESIEKKKDKAFNKFQKRVKLEPQQVLRYERGGEPLWASSENIPSEKDIPNCSCGAKRQFEFQVMPQLLHYLSLDSIQYTIDWGTLIVYTCSASCASATEKYVKEFLWKQDFSNVSDFKKK